MDKFKDVAGLLYQIIYYLEKPKLPRTILKKHS